VSGGIEDFYVHTVEVEQYVGTGAYGDVYTGNTPSDTTYPGPNDFPGATLVSGFLEGKNVLVRAQDGQQVVASSTFYCSVADGALFPPDSKVTFGGRVCYVISQNINDAPGLGLPEHAAIYLK